MEQVKIDFTVDKLQAVNHTFKYSSLEHTTDRKIKTTRSIMAQLTAKLLKKAIDKTTTTKPFKITLKYHEADVLEVYLRMFIGTDMVTKYMSVLINIVANDINQKLA